MIIGWYNPLFTLNNKFFFIAQLVYSNLFKSSYRRKNMQTSNPLNLMIRRERHLAIRRQSRNDTWDANPSHPMPLACWTALQMYNIFLYKIHRSSALICYLWTNKRPPEKTISWRHGSDCEIDIDLAGGQRGTTTRLIRKHGNVIHGGCQDGRHVAWASSRRTFTQQGLCVSISWNWFWLFTAIHYLP